MRQRGAPATGQGPLSDQTVVAGALLSGFETPVNKPDKSAPATTVWSGSALRFMPIRSLRGNLSVILVDYFLRNVNKGMNPHGARVL